MSAAAQAMQAEADLFAGELPNAADEDLANAVRSSRITFAGVIQSIEVRARTEQSSGLPSYVVQLEVKVDGPVPHTIRADRVHEFRQEADREANSLHKGQHIRFTAPLLGMRVYLPAVEFLTP